MPQSDTNPVSVMQGEAGWLTFYEPEGQVMLVLSRKQHESIVVGGTDGSALFVKVTVLEINNGVVKLGFDASPDVLIHRLEVWERIQGGLSVKSG